MARLLKRTALLAGLNNKAADGCAKATTTSLHLALCHFKPHLLHLYLVMSTACSMKGRIGREPEEEALRLAAPSGRDPLWKMEATRGAPRGASSPAEVAMVGLWQEVEERLRLNSQAAPFV